jgi:hypothetical protein
MSTIPSSKLQHQEQRERDHKDRVNECKLLLDQLNDGIYTIDLNNLDISANGNIRNKTNDNSVTIVVETSLDIKRMIHFKKPHLTKKITISNNDISYLESWSRDEILELNSNLVLILHGFCQND